MKEKYKQGFTLMEVLVTALVLAVASVGSLSYQFHSVREAKLAKRKIAATRIGSMILESWKSQGGDENYDPSLIDLDIIRVPKTDNYLLLIEDVPYYFNLSYKDVQTHSETSVTLRQITILIRWRSDFSSLTPRDTDPKVEFNTYVRLDQSGG